MAFDQLKQLAQAVDIAAHHGTKEDYDKAVDTLVAYSAKVLEPLEVYIPTAGGPAYLSRACLGDVHELCHKQCRVCGAECICACH